MQNPLVSFVIPCYKLGHLLPQCIASILAQTYGNYEVLIMDDCSPDNTPEVACLFQDDRIRHIRNQKNLGHLRNYNKGISMCRGKYVWLISADDYLRRPYILQRYVDLMEKHPRVGYAFCPAVGVKGACETEILDYSVIGGRDRIISGHVFLRKLLRKNVVVAASAMARRECYEKISYFPLDTYWAGTPIDFGWNGDWYLWCMFALHYDVAYFAEPMVCYREHELSMTSALTHEDKVDNCSAADIGMLWLLRQKASECGLRNLAEDCLSAVADEYARHGASKQYQRATSSMSVDQFEASLCRSTTNEQERNRIRGRYFEARGDRLYWCGDLPSARTFYLLSLQKHLRAKVYAKLLLLRPGSAGDYLRRIFGMSCRPATNSLTAEL